MRIPSLLAAVALALTLAACSDDSAEQASPPSDQVEASPAVEQTLHPEPDANLTLEDGSYTWPSGITLEVDARALTRKEYCAEAADNYCDSFEVGTSPVVLVDYTISVPEGYPGGRFEAYGCPGALNPVVGDPNAIVSTLGAFDAEVESVLAGGSQNGTVEYDINDPALLGEELYIESECGDPEETGEQWVAFRGFLE